MKAEVKFWKDTGNLDLLVQPETETETAVLQFMAERKVKLVAMRTDNGQLEIVFNRKTR